MQNNLLGKKKTPIEIKESYGGFEVRNFEHLDFKDSISKPFRMGELIVKKYSSYEEAKKSFEKEVKEAYQTEVVWLKSKFQDSFGFFWLNGVKVKWTLKAFYITEYHFDFSSKSANLITETGYRSYFPSNLDCYDSVKDCIKDIIEGIINCDETGKKNKKIIKYQLDWENKGFKTEKQGTLISLQGGEK